MPVDKTTLCADGTAGKEIAKLTSGTDANGRLNYQGKLYDFSGTGAATTSTEKTGYGQETTSNREPALLSRYDVDAVGYINYNTIGITSDSLQQEYNAIIESIKNNGGFYVGRYEASLNTSNNIQSKPEVMPTSVNNSNTSMWYGLYAKEKAYASTLTGTTVKSAMITGSCYDAMLNWALNGSDKSKVTATGNGNHSSSVATTGDETYSNDKTNNIFDLEGNVREWTSEADGTVYRVSRRRQLQQFLFSERS